MEGDGYEPLFPQGGAARSSQEAPAETPSASASSRGSLKRKAPENEGEVRTREYSISVGPKFRKGHETPFRATNVQMINARGNSKRLLAHVIKEIDEGISFSDECDIVLNTLIHPESPKLITIRLSSIDKDSILDGDIASTRVPLYLNLVDFQWDDIKNQYGIDDKEGAWSVEMNRARSNSTKYQPTASGRVSSAVSASSLESFVNEVMGRFGRYNVNNEATWDKNQKFFQPIDFKIRVGPQFKYSYKGLDGVRRGQANWEGEGIKMNQRPINSEDFEEVDDVFASQVQPYDQERAPKLFGTTILKELREVSAGDKTEEQKREEEMWEEVQKQAEAMELTRKNFREDGLDQASVPEHKFRMTSHMALSPAFRSAISQAMSYLGDSVPRSKKDFERTFLGRSETRTHLATIVEAELKETDVSITRYQDPQALRAVHKKKVYAAYMLKKLLNF